MGNGPCGAWGCWLEARPDSANGEIEERKGFGSAVNPRRATAKPSRQTRNLRFSTRCAWPHDLPADRKASGEEQSTTQVIAGCVRYGCSVL